MVPAPKLNLLYLLYQEAGIATTLLWLFLFKMTAPHRSLLT